MGTKLRSGLRAASGADWRAATLAAAITLLGTVAMGLPGAQAQGLRGGRETPPSAAPDAAPSYRAPQEDPRARLLRFEEAIRDNPDDMAARLGLARALIDVGDYGRAEKMARVALRRERTETSRMIVAEALFWQGQVDEADQLLGTAGYIGGDDFLSLKAIVSGEAALMSGDPEEALRRVKDAERHPRFGDMARLIAARSQYARGDLFRARRLVEDIIAQGRRNVPTLVLRAQMALRSGDLVRARALTDQIDQMLPGNIAGGVIAVETMLRQGDVGAAKAKVASLTTARSTDPRPAYLNALVLAAEGDVRGAIDAVSNVEPWLAETPGGAIFLADLKLASGRERQAETILRRRLNQDPLDFPAMQLLVRLLDQTARSAEADAMLAEAMAGGDDSENLRRLRIDRLLASGQYDDAATLLGDEMKADGSWVAALARLQMDDPAAPPTLGGRSEDLVRVMAALRSGDYPRAGGLASEALAGDPDNPLLLNLQAAARLQSGDELTARRILEDLVQQYPNFFAAIVNLAALSEERTALLNRLEQALERGATSAKIHHQLSIERFVLGDVAGALSAAQAAALADDAVLRDRLLRPRLLLAVGQEREAQTELRRLGSTGPSDVESRLGIAQMMGDAGLPREGAALIATMTLGDAPVEQILALADLYEAAGDDRERLSLLAVAHEAQPGNLLITEAWLSALAKRDMTWARESLAGLDLTDPDIAVGLEARMLAASGDKAGARALLNRAPVSYPVLSVSFSLADTLSQRRIVLRRVNEYLVRTPADPRVLILKSGLALDLGERAIAAEALSEALALVPRDPVLMNNLALAESTRSLDQALALAAEAYAATPGNAAIAETYATLLIEAGQPDLAARVARRALLTAPVAETLRAIALPAAIQ